MIDYYYRKFLYIERIKFSNNTFNEKDIEP